MHRLGQSRPVRITRFVMAGSVGNITQCPQDGASALFRLILYLDQRKLQFPYHVGILDELFLIWSPVIEAPADPIKLFDPKLNKNKSEFDRSNFLNKETVYALKYLYVKLFLIIKLSLVLVTNGKAQNTCSLPLSLSQGLLFLKPWLVLLCGTVLKNTTLAKRFSAGATAPLKQ